LLRYRAFTRVIEHLQVIDEPYVAHDSHVPYRLAYAVNTLVRELQGKVLIINYADVIVSHSQMMRAILLAEEEPGQVFAFDEYHRVGEPDGDFEIPIDEVNSNGCMAIQRDCFLEVGGYDERFVGWAMEDLEFNDRCGERWPARRVPGRLDHLWHGERRDDDSALETSAEQIAANRAYYHSLSWSL
jgi:GT2 family glycosyltransferase